MAGLQNGIFLERNAIFHAFGNARKAWKQLDLHRREPGGLAGSKLKFPELAGISRGAVQLDQIAAAFF